MNPDTEYEYEYESYVPPEPFESQDLLRWLQRLVPLFLFLVGAIMIKWSQSIAMQLVSTSRTDHGMVSRSWEPSDLADETLCWKIIGGGVILYGAALLSRRQLAIPSQ